MPYYGLDREGRPNQLVQAQLEQARGNSVQLTLSDWDKPVTVTKPRCDAHHSRAMSSPGRSRQGAIGAGSLF